MSLPTFPIPSDPATPSRLVIWVLGFLSFLNVYAMQSVLPNVTQDFQASPTQAGLMVGATVLAIALVSPFMGMLSDAWGRKPIIVTCLFALTVPTVAIAVASSLNMMLLMRFLQGLAVPGMVVVLVAYLSEECRSSGLARMTTTFISGTVMGGFSGRFITGHVGEWLNWRWAFVVLALINLMGAVLVWRRLPASRHFVPNHNLAAGLQLLVKHLKNPRLLAICALGCCLLFTMLGTFTYVNFYLSSAPFNLNSAGLANVFMVYLVGAIITPMTGPIIARHGFLRAVLGGLAASALGLMLTLVSWLPAVLLGLVLCSSGVFVCQSATIGRIAERVSEGRSLATGLYYLSYYAGGAMGTWIPGLAYERFAWLGAVLAIASFQALAAWIAVRFLRQAPN